ncbi:MAG: SMP-30/gluconolactonase/LRE family protein [Dermatophilaceae bacterium]
MRTLAHGFMLAEGPTVDPVDPGRVVVSDVIAGGLCRVSLAARDEPASPWALDGRRGVGGVAAHADGGLVVTGRTVMHLGPAGQERDLLDRGDGATGFNDVGPTPEGGLLTGALRIRPARGEMELPADLVHVDQDGQSRTWASRAMLWPNGIGFTPDGADVMVADFATGVVHRSPWRPGEPAELTPWLTTPTRAADGLSVDQWGRLWVALGAGGGVAVYAPDATLLRVVDVAARFVSSVCHAGVDRRTLVITTMHDAERGDDPNGAVLAVDVDVPGVPLAPVVV